MFFDLPGRPLFGTMSGVYYFDENRQRFFPDTSFNEALGDDPGGSKWIKFLQQAPSGDVWFVADEEVGYLEIEDKGLAKSVVKKTIPGLADKLLVSGFECIYPYDNENVFFGSDEGFIHLNLKKLDLDSGKEIRVLLRQINVFAKKDSVVFGSNHHQARGEEGVGEVLRLPPEESAIRFYYSAPWYEGESPIQYQCYLEGLDQGWSEWSTKTEKEYNNLPPGDYAFHVRARKNSKPAAGELVLPFHIAAPWYQTALAKATFGTILLCFLAGIIFFQRKRFETEAAELKSEHQEREREQQRLVEEAAEQLTLLRHESLKRELQFRQKQLTTTAMHLMQKGELLTTIKAALQKATKEDQSTQQMKSEIKRLIRMLEQDSILDESWEQFISHFDQVHADFFKRLHSRFPKLTTYDQKMCAYLKMNLTTKEIATLLNISIRGVEGGRYRLRKKLSLPKQTNLVKFIQEL